MYIMQAQIIDKNIIAVRAYDTLTFAHERWTLVDDNNNKWTNKVENVEKEITSTATFAMHEIQIY